MQLLGKTPTGSGDEDRISVDLTAVPEGVARIVVAASQYGGARFGDLDDLRMTVADRAGEPLVGFSIHDAGVETAFIFGELYRRGEEWKFRAVGQGYETGLAGLATDFGISVLEETEDSGEGGEGGESAKGEGAGDGDAEPAAQGAPAAKAGPVPPAAPAGPVAPAAEGTAAVPAQTRGRSPRTTRKKVTLPKVARNSLAENDSWRPARLFPVPTLKSDKEHPRQHRVRVHPQRRRGRGPLLPGGGGAPGPRRGARRQQPGLTESPVTGGRFKGRPAQGRPPQTSVTRRPVWAL
ncbi:TerD family protein [Streptomyces sp. NPDC058304]|uniref:TerD family protein n=1 Tax=Streptomyces sp. NPDC058304 TaxID=3346437 RepID=UPI0036E3EB74